MVNKMIQPGMDQCVGSKIVGKTNGVAKNANLVVVKVPTLTDASAYIKD
jgi:hypothetical protein